jgi:hypothetical protein
VARVQVAEAELLQAKSGFYPSLDLTGTVYLPILKRIQQSSLNFLTIGQRHAAPLATWLGFAMRLLPFD